MRKSHAQQRLCVLRHRYAFLQIAPSSRTEHDEGAFVTRVLITRALLSFTRPMSLHETAGERITPGKLPVGRAPGGPLRELPSPLGSLGRDVTERVRSQDKLRASRPVGGLRSPLLGQRVSTVPTH